MTSFSTDDHPRRYPGFSWVYPVLSRRRGGISLGLNLNPDKVCNFRCVYCQVDRHVPGHEHDVDAEAALSEVRAVLDLQVAGRLAELPGFGELAGPRILDVSFSGDGEPTTARSFPELLAGVRALVRGRELDLPVIVFTNATRVHRPAILGALRSLMAARGQVWAKLDAGTDAGFLRWAGVAMPADRIAANLELLAAPEPSPDPALRRPATGAWGFHIQILLCRDAGGPISMAEVEAIAGRLAHMARAGGRVREIQVTTVARPTPDPAVRALDSGELERRVAALRALQPFPVRLYR